MSQNEMKQVNITRAMIDTNSLGNAGDNIQASVELMSELEQRYQQLTNQVSSAIQLRRLARAAVARAEAANAMQVAYQAEFLHFVGENCPDVKNWDIWPLPPRKDESGDIIMETPCSEEDVRKSAAVVHKVQNDNADAILGAGPKKPENFSGMFGEETPPQE